MVRGTLAHNRISPCHRERDDDPGEGGALSRMTPGGGKYRSLFRTSIRALLIEQQDFRVYSVLAFTFVLLDPSGGFLSINFVYFS